MGAPGRFDSDTRLLLRMPSWLGDFVMAEPHLAACVRALEEGRLASLSIVGPARFLELLDGTCHGKLNGAADGREGPVRRLGEDGPQSAWRGHDAALFLDGSLRSLWRARQARIPVRWSWYSGGRWALASHGHWPACAGGAEALHLGSRSPLLGPRSRHLPRPFGAKCGELLGAAGITPASRAPKFRPTARGLEQARKRQAALGLAPGAPFFVLDVSARANSAKAPAAEFWALVVESLQASGAPQLVSLTAPGEEGCGAQLKELATGAGVHVTEPPPDLAELLALVSLAAVFLGADSGPRHLAAATGTPALVLFGPSDRRHTADHSATTRGLSAPVPCGPCHHELCNQSGSNRQACFWKISPVAVAASALELWRACQGAQAP